MFRPTDSFHSSPYSHFECLQSCYVHLSHCPCLCAVKGYAPNQRFNHSFLEASFQFFNTCTDSQLPHSVTSSPDWIISLRSCFPALREKALLSVSARSASSFISFFSRLYRLAPSFIGWLCIDFFLFIVFFLCIVCFLCSVFLTCLVRTAFSLYISFPLKCLFSLCCLP